MHRRVLIAEQADTVRAVAEAVLRQNGFDVIAVTAAEKAREVLELSRPDLLIIGADLASVDGTPYYQRLRQDPRTVKIPTLLIEPADKSQIAASDLTVIPRPFDPQDLLQKVTMALSVGSKPAAQVVAPLAGAEIDDDFLDAALGLGNIDVTSSEVMDRTSLGLKKPVSGAGEKLIGMETNHNRKLDETGATKIEAVILEEDKSRVISQNPDRKSPVEGTGKLEILDDQYGMEKPLPPLQHEKTDHDYDWFVDAIKSDNAPSPQNKTTHHDSGKPATSTRSVTVDPHGTPPPEGVEKFIDEFKKEMRQLRDVETEPVIPEVKTIKTAALGDKLEWEEKIEQIGPAEMEIFTREFAQELGRRVAEIVVAKIDPDKLMRLIRADVVERYQKKK